MYRRRRSFGSRWSPVKSSTNVLMATTEARRPPSPPPRFLAALMRLSSAESWNTGSSRTMTVAAAILSTSVPDCDTVRSHCSSERGLLDSERLTPSSECIFLALSNSCSTLSGENGSSRLGALESTAAVCFLCLWRWRLGLAPSVAPSACSTGSFGCSGCTSGISGSSTSEYHVIPSPTRS